MFVCLFIFVPFPRVKSKRRMEGVCVCVFHVHTPLHTLDECEDGGRCPIHSLKVWRWLRCGNAGHGIPPSTSACSS